MERTGKITTWLVRGTLFLLLFGFATSTSYAEKRKKKSSSSSDGFVTETRSDGTKVKYKKKTRYEFEGTDIEGIFNKPSGAYISNVEGVKGRPIIRIRKDFDEEVIDTTRSVY